MTALVEKTQNRINAGIERQHQEEFKDIARAMEDGEKNIVLRTITTEDLLKELSRRCELLESRDKAIKELFRIPCEE